MTEQQTEVLPGLQITVKFIFDPDFVPSWFSKGKIDYKKTNYSPDFYTEERAIEWDQFSNQVFENLHSHLRLSYLSKNLTCRVLKDRIKVHDKLFLEAHFNPLTIWAIPPHNLWGHLPFHARVIHEIIHNIGPSATNWEVLMSETYQKLGNVYTYDGRDVEELLIRNLTYKVTSDVFDKDFANWFLERESKIVPN